MNHGRWAFLRTMTLRNSDGTPYLKRWRLFECPWFGVYLHRIDGPDEGRALHDHPWPFISFVLRGHYIEELHGHVTPAMPWPRPHHFVVNGPGNDSVGMIRNGRDVRWLNAKRATDQHRIAWVRRGTWTLIFRGPRVRNWGFTTDEGWIDHDHYFVNPVFAETRADH